MSKIIKSLVLSSLIASQWISREKEFLKVELTTNLETKLILNKSRAISGEILWQRLYNVDWAFNEDLKKTIFYIWKEVQKILPKWIKCKLKENDIRCGYIYKF